MSYFDQFASASDVFAQVLDVFLLQRIERCQIGRRESGEFFDR